MKAQDLIAELGNKLNIALSLETGTCRIIFDEDIVDFELVDSTLFVLAELGAATGRQEAYERFLRANFAGQHTGGAVISLDKDRYMLHMLLSDDTTYVHFESALEHFIKALRYWKEWLALPPSSTTHGEQFDMGDTSIRV